MLCQTSTNDFGIQAATRVVEQPRIHFVEPDELSEIWFGINDHIDRRAHELGASPQAELAGDHRRPVSELLEPVAIRTSESGDEVTVAIGLSTVSPEDVFVGLDSNRVTVCASSPDGRRPWKAAFKVFNLTTPIDPKSARAKLFEGTIHLMLPKL